MAKRKLQDDSDTGLQWAIERVVQTKEGLELVQAVLKLGKLGTIAERAQRANRWIALGLLVLRLAGIEAQLAREHPQLAARAITVSELMTSSALLGFPIDHTVAVNIVQAFMDKKLIDRQHRPLPGITDAIAGAEC